MKPHIKPYPLLFQPDLQERVWGGRNLERFGLPLPEGKIGEAWMIADHPNGVSTVTNGALAGMGLDEVRREYGREFFGEKAADEPRFPLLVKLLDCDDDLSVQVHPADDYDRLPAGEKGKTEMWYVLDATPGAQIIYGLKEGFTRDKLEALIREGRIMEGLNAVDVAPGDSFYIPAGTVHALGKGVLVAEIQQNSDTTYRLYDYDRPGLDGKPRELHIEDSLNVISYTNEGASRMKTPLERPHTWLTLARSPYFIVEKGKVSGSWTLSTSLKTFTMLIVVDGEGELAWADGQLEVHPGNTLLLPASLGSYTLKSADLTVLQGFLP